MNSDEYSKLVEKGSYPNDPEVVIDHSFKNNNGEIKNLLLQTFTSVALIDSVTGSVRANHYHKTDWHYCYVIEGKIEYFHREFNSSKKTELIIVERGNMVFTPPLVEHCMKFPVDTLFLTLSRNPRDQETYEADVVRVNLIDASNSISWKPNEF